MTSTHRKTHLVIDARESGTSTGVYIDNLIKYLHALRPEYRVTVLSKKHRVEFLRAAAPHFTVVTTRFKEFTFGEQLGFLRQIMKLRPDLVHFGMVQQPVLYRGKVVTTMHDLTGVRYKNPAKNSLLFAVKQAVYKLVNRWVAKKSAAIITPSEFVKDDVARFADINSSKITVTYEAADAIADQPEPFDELEDQQFIMYVGRPQPHKNLRRLIDAFSELQKKHPKLKLVLVGKQDLAYRQLAHYAKKHGVDNIIFTGWVSEGQKRWLYEHAAAYVFPSLSEGFGLPTLEAMTHGAPVVCSHATCLPEINKDGALYFDPNDINDLVSAVNRVLTDKKLSQSLIKKGAVVAKEYSWRRMAEQTLAVYKKVLEKH